MARFGANVASREMHKVAAQFQAFAD